MVEELLSNIVAAQVLNELMPNKTPEQWELWLRNNRNQSRRVPYRIPFERISNGTFYNREELAKFAEFEKSRQLGTIRLTGRSAEVMRAFGIGSAGGSSTGRRLKVTGINPQVDEATGKLFIQIIADDPLTVWRLEPEEAKTIFKELGDALGCLERTMATQQGREKKSDQTEYKTVTDNQDVLVQRRIEK